MGLLRHVGTGAVLAALAVVCFAAPAAAQSTENDLLKDAIDALESGDDVAYAQAVDLISVSGVWLPDLGHRALRLQDEGDLRLVWLLFESDEIELYDLSVSVLSLERDAIAFQVPEDEQTRAFVQDSDRQAEAIMQMLDHRRIPMPESAREVMRLLPSDDSVPGPAPAAYEIAIDEFATLATGGSVALSPVPTTIPPTTAEPVAAPTVTAQETPPASAAPIISESDAQTSESRGLLAGIAVTMGTATVLLGLAAVARSRRPDRPSTTESTRNALGNRRRFDSDLVHEATFGQRPTALVVVGIDADAAAHDDGSNDEVLAAVAETIAGSIRHTDIAYRFTSCEFGILLPSTPHRDAIRIAERVRRAIDDLPAGREHHIAASVGVATGEAEHVDELFDQADDAAAAARRAGGRDVAIAPVG